MLLRISCFLDCSARLLAVLRLSQRIKLWVLSEVLRIDSLNRLHQLPSALFRRVVTAYRHAVDNFDHEWYAEMFTDARTRLIAFSLVVQEECHNVYSACSLSKYNYNFAAVVSISDKQRYHASGCQGDEVN